MAFTDTQIKALKAKLRHRHVRTRYHEGVPIAYVEGWHVIAEANRIFGFDSWDRQTQSPDCVWSAVQRGQTVCFYSTKVRITVRAAETVTVREGIGTGIGRSPLPDVAHEMGLKAAETDATKRALATFGNPFGLALYDRDQSQVTRPRGRAVAGSTAEAPSAPLLLTLASGQEATCDDADSFIAAMLLEVGRLDSIDAVYAFWADNLNALAALATRVGAKADGATAQIAAALKARLREIAGMTSQNSGTKATALPSRNGLGSALLIPKEKRIRHRAHLAFVASQPCLVCGRRPARAHHLRFAQPRAMSMKVSDEFTLPLCNTHHDSVHQTADERAWWARHGIIEPLKYAERLWTASRLGPDGDRATRVDTPGPLDPAPNEAPPADARRAGL